MIGILFSLVRPLRCDGKIDSNDYDLINYACTFQGGALESKVYGHYLHKGPYSYKKVLEEADE